VPLDVVVNVDGFNEVALGGADAEGGFHPLFPSRHHHRAVVELSRGAPSPDTILLTAEILLRRGAVETLRQRFTTSTWLGRSEFAKAIGGAMILRHEALAATAERELQTLAASSVGESPIAALEDPCLGQSAECWDLIAGIWERSSILMNGMARTLGARYVHVLQPNQYVEGSKRLSEVERQTAFHPDEQWNRMAREGYPHLRRRGAELRRLDVEFHDLTQVFTDHGETLYRDTCCHLNLHGNEILAEAIGDLVGSEQ
jgi:hypothetical protein